MTQRRRRLTKKTGSSSTGPAVAQEAPSAAKGLKQQFLVRIENLMPQTLEVSVLDESGSVEGLRLPPRGKSHPIDIRRVGQHTHDLAERGRVRIVQTG